MARTWLYSLAVLVGLTPAAMAACNPPQSPLGSPGCQPDLSPAQGSDLIMIWRPSSFPNSLGTTALSNFANSILATTLASPPPIGGVIPNAGTFSQLNVTGGINAANLPTSCAGRMHGDEWNNGNTVSICP